MTDHAPPGVRPGPGEQAQRPVRVLVADAHPLLRSGVRTLLSQAPGLAVVGEAGDGVAAVERARRLLPDVLLTDVRLPRRDAAAATRAVVAARLPVQVLLLCDDPQLDEAALAALRAGARGLLPKDVPAGELAAAVQAVAAGEVVISPPVLRQLLDQLRELAPAPPPSPPADLLQALTAREREVLALVARGHSNAEIAAALSVGDTTVKTHVGNVLTKLGLRDRVQAVVLAYESGLVHPRGR